MAGEVVAAERYAKGDLQKEKTPKRDL